jgi:ribosomal protein S18 acetylase RimI-like enzyme
MDTTDAQQDARPAEWHLMLKAPDDEAFAVLARDRVWNCFAIADLAPPFRAHSQIALARRTEGDDVAACLVVRHPAVRVLSPYGALDGVAALLESIELPERTLVQAQTAHVPALERHYRLPDGPVEMLRMAVTSATLVVPQSAPLARVELLRPADLDALGALYRMYPGSVFRPDLLEQGIFCGVKEGDRLVAAGGTHVLAAGYGVAVLGNIFTHPAARGQGLATAVTARLVTDLLARGCPDVVLNVHASNDVAIRVYTRLGFRIHSRYLTGQAERLPA